MIKKIKQKLQKEEHKRLLSNFISLALLQGANYVLPLITFPYLVRVLGVEKFGLLAFASATIAYFNILTDYGFNLTATREISIYRDNKSKLNEIFSSVMIIKFILMIVSFILLLVLIFSFSKFKEDYKIFILTFGMVIGQVLFPQWFFQGMERMKYITFLNILAKGIFTIAIFVFIHKSSDYWKVPLINSLGFIVAGVIALYIIFKDFKIKFSFQRLNVLRHYFIDGWHIFISGIFGNIYSQGSIIILSIFTSEIIVGYYSIATRLCNVVINVFQVLVQSFFPYINKLKQKNYKAFRRFLKNVIYYGIGSGVIFVFVNYIFANKIYFLFTGNKDIIGLFIYKSWIVISLFTIINVLLNPFLLVLKQDKWLSRLYITIGILFLVVSLFLVYIWSYKGMLGAMLLVELSIFLFYSFKLLQINKKGNIK